MGTRKRPRSELDATTHDADTTAPARVTVPTLRAVLRGDDGIVDEPSHRLDAGETPVGRGGSGLVLEGDPLASREHARFVVEGSGVTVEDLRSRNGVFVDGRRVKRETLRDGSVVRLGATLFVVRFEDPRQVDVPDPLLVGGSPALQRVRSTLRRVGPADAHVLVVGETGTGKEQVALALHRESKRSGPFVAVNCAAIGESLAESLLFGHVAGAFTGAVGAAQGFFRAADKGTLLLDELGDAPPPVQAKLLRALETGKVTPVGSTQPAIVNVRVVAATNVELDGAIADGRFREDLLARVAQVRIALPPLRERPEDVLPLLAKHLDVDALPPLDPDLAEALLLHRFPRNAREVQSFARALSIFGPGNARLDLAVLEAAGIAALKLPRGPTLETPASTVEPSRDEPPPDADSLRALLAEHGGNVASVARAVGRSRMQVYRWMTRLGIER